MFTRTPHAFAVAALTCCESFSLGAAPGSASPSTSSSSSSSASTPVRACVPQSARATATRAQRKCLPLGAALCVRRPSKTEKHKVRNEEREHVRACNRIFEAFAAEAGAVRRHDFACERRRRRASVAVSRRFGDVATNRRRVCAHTLRPTQPGVARRRRRPRTTEAEEGCARRAHQLVWNGRLTVFQGAHNVGRKLRQKHVIRLAATGGGRRGT